MFTEDELKLLTATIDGELTPAERLRLDELILRSPEAAAILARLQCDQQRLVRLAPPTPPSNLQSRIMAALGAMSAIVPAAKHRESVPRTQPHRARPTWAQLLPLSLAASVLIAVGASSFWFFAHEPRNTGSVASANSLTGESHRAGETEWSNWLPIETKAPPSVPANTVTLPNTPLPRDPLAQDITVPPANSTSGQADIHVAPSPRPARAPIHAAPLTPAIPPLELVQLRLPFLKAVVELEREDIQQQFIETLSRDPAVRIDLFTTDTVRAVELLQAIAQKTRIHLHIDASTIALLRKRHVTSVVLYTESLTATELANVFSQLHVLDARKAPAVLDLLHASGAVPADRDAIREILGIDPGLFKRAGNAKDQPRDGAGQSISSGTTDHIVNTVKAKPGNAEAKHAVLLAWGPASTRTAPTASQELKHYLSKRGDRSENAIPAIIVIRSGTP